MPQDFKPLLPGVRTCFLAEQKKKHLSSQTLRQDVSKTRAETALFIPPHEKPLWMITRPNDNDDDYNGEAAAAADDDEGRR